MSYLGYVLAQVRQSFAKRHKPPREHFLDLVVASTALPYATPILCLGPRNRAELDGWRHRGFHAVEGVDLLPSHGVKLGDMHRLPYEEDQFGLVYASHCLEHAYSPAQVAREILRVLRPGGWFFAAFPVNFTPNAHDRFDYRHPDGLLRWFASATFTRIWGQTTPTEAAVLVRMETKA